MVTAPRVNALQSYPAPSQRLSRAEMAAVAVFLLVAWYVLTPRFWEPGGETWKQWAAARILKETGGFPTLSLGLGYVAYLQPFLLLDYPLAVQVEYTVTHLFCYTSIFLMLRGCLSLVPSLVFAMAWIPSLAVVEPSGAVAGVAFLALYLSNRHALWNRGYFPTSLGIAALCHSAYAAFFAGHVIGKVIEQIRMARIAEMDTEAPVSVGRLPLALNGGVLILLLLALLFPSNRQDRNHMMIDPAYAPIPLMGKDPLTIGFFQIGNWKYVKRTEPESTWIHQDWYVTNEKAFGGATTILEALVAKPETVRLNVLENLRSAVNLPTIFLGGPALAQLGSWVFGLASWIMLAVGWIGLLHAYPDIRYLSCRLSLILGTSVILVSFLLTWFSLRYAMTLLPVGLLLVAHIGPGLQAVASRLDHGVVPIRKVGSNFQGNLGGQGSGRRLGVGLVMASIVCNEWTLGALFSPDGILSASSSWSIRLGEGLLFAAGIMWLFVRRPVVSILLSNASWLRQGVVLVSAGCALFMSYYPHGRYAQVEAVIDQRGFLSEADPVSMMDAHREFKNILTAESKVLMLEDNWGKAFTRLNLDHILNVFSLPPFADPSARTEKMLAGLDIIAVSAEWAAAVPSVGTQSYLRYRLHVEPFLKKAVAQGWTEEVVKGYGHIYRRPALDQHQKRAGTRSAWRA